MLSIDNLQCSLSLKIITVYTTPFRQVSVYASFQLRGVKFFYGNQKQFIRFVPSAKMVFYKHPIFVCIIFVIVPNIGGFLGSLFTDTSDQSWYDNLQKPSFNPPNWVDIFQISLISESLIKMCESQIFFPAWTILYLMIGFASFWVWYKGGGFSGKAKVPLIIYFIQLILNWSWTPVFFGLELLLASFIVICVLCVFAVITTILFFRVNTIAGFFMLPYLGWLSFATLLNFSLWHLNT